MKVLVNVNTGVAINVGDTVRSFRGELWRVDSLHPDRGSKGKLCVHNPHDPNDKREFYPSVFDADFRVKE